MAALVTPTEVKQIIDTDLADDIINAFILAADSVVVEVLGTDTTLTAARKKVIERWLTAHLVATTREPQMIKGGAGGASVTYQGITGKGLESTFYGQQCMLLDTTGKMRGLTGKVASMKAVASFSD